MPRQIEYNRLEHRQPEAHEGIALTTHIPTDRLYNASHEWAQTTDDGTVLIGITDYAQAELGDVVYVDLPQIGQQLAKSAAIGVLESVKAVSEIFAPVSGTVVRVNTQLDAHPDAINLSPYSDGWIVAIKPEDPTEIQQLLKAEDYRTKVE
ncbi:MAG: glycine cleavage system protein GcvH [Gammaproteobacteria bacterium]